MLLCLSGVTLGKEALQRMADLTGAAGTWLICDNTYEQFLFSGKQHFAINAPNIVHVFSFSKVPNLSPYHSTTINAPFDKN